LIVRVIGSGYDDGSVVRFLLNGEAAPKMIVNSTHFVNPDSLDVDLTIELTADTVLYDIEVMTARGKKGIGSEKFQVRQKGAPTDTPVSATFRDAPGDGVTSDSVTSNGIDNSYDSTAVINTIGNLFLDARVDIPRKLCLYFAGQPNAPEEDALCDDGYLSTAQPEIEGGMLAMAPGSSMRTTSQVTWVRRTDPTDRNSGYNWFLRFGEEDCGTELVVDNRSTVEHPDTDTWILTGTSACLSRMKVKGRPEVEAVGFFDMPFELTLLRQ
jgi:hypothetical protein